MIDMTLLDPALVHVDSVEKMHRENDHPADRLAAYIGTAAVRTLTWPERQDALAAIAEYRTRLRDGGW